MTAQEARLRELNDQLVKALGIPAPDKKAKQLMNKFIQEQLQQGKTVQEILAQAVPVRGANV
jgi:ferritin